MTADNRPVKQGQFEFLRECLYSSDEDAPDAGVSMVRVADKGSKPQCVRVEVHGVPAYGVLESAQPRACLHQHHTRLTSVSF